MANMKIRSLIQKIVGKLTGKHCLECKFRYKDRCTRLDFKGSFCRKGVYPIGYAPIVLNQ